MRIPVACAVALVLTGCGVSRMAEGQKVRDQTLALQAACRERKERGEFKTYVEAARCNNEAEELQRPYYQFPDLLSLKTATRLALAEKVDAGRMTPAEARLEFAKMSSSMASEEQRRRIANRTVAAQEGIAEAATQQNRPVTCYGGPAFASCF